jgi:hypothetical protein
MGGCWGIEATLRPPPRRVDRPFPDLRYSWTEERSTDWRLANREMGFYLRFYSKALATATIAEVICAISSGVQMYGGIA